MTEDLQELERQKYEFVWDHPFYRTQADGDPVVDLAFKQMGCVAGESLIDWGCGKGTPAQKFVAKGLKVTGFDIAHNCRDEGITVPLVVGCLWDPVLPRELMADYAFCTDVLEHLPPRHVPAALFNIATRTRRAAFIQVCTGRDSSGKKMNPPQVLHLTVQPTEVWRDWLQQHWGKVTDSLVKGKERASFLCFK